MVDGIENATLQLQTTSIILLQHTVCTILNLDNQLKKDLVYI